MVMSAKTVERSDEMWNLLSALLLSGLAFGLFSTAVTYSFCGSSDRTEDSISVPTTPKLGRMIVVTTTWSVHDMAVAQVSEPTVGT